MRLIVKKQTNSDVIGILKDTTCIPRIGEGITMIVNNDFDTFRVEELYYMYDETGVLNEIVIYIDNAPFQLPKG